MDTIAVANQKGGVAKTTTALSLAASLALEGRRTLALDLDPQANLTEGAGLDPCAPPPSLYEVLTGRTALDEAALGCPHPDLPGLAVAPAGARLAQAEAELIGQVGFDEVLKHKLRGAGDAWDAAVLDCPPSLGALTVNALGAADLVVIPVQCEYFSARGVVKLMELVELVRERRNPDLGVWIVPTLYDQRNNICRAVLTELKKSFPGAVSDVVVGVDTRVRESQARRTPISVYAPKSRASRAYRALAREVIARSEGGTDRVQQAA